MNFKRGKPKAFRRVSWGSPISLQPNRELPQVDGIIAYRKFPQRKVCKITKANHNYKMVSIMRGFADKFFINLQCDCGKKSWIYKYAEAFTQEEAKLWAVQTTQDPRRNPLQSA